MSAVPVKRLFHSGGTLGKGHIYVEREADRELLKSLQSGRYSYVLAPRQVGKSSLWAHVESQMPTDTLCVKVDLSGITDSEIRESGTGASGERPLKSTAEVARLDTKKSQWYLGLLNRMWLALQQKYPQFTEQLEEPYDYWIKLDMPISAKFSAYFITKLQPIFLHNKKLCICIDEIDQVQSLPFSCDDFFTSIRYLSNNRSEFEQLRNISFCILGAASPTQLMENIAITPFNIGDRIELRHFRLEETRIFCDAWRKVGVKGDLEALLGAIMGWTNGHPYMTHKLCEKVAEEQQSSMGEDARAWVERIVQSHFLGRPLKDPLAHAEQQILKHPRQIELLLLWTELLRKERILAGQHRLKPHEDPLILSGLAIKDSQLRDLYLVPSNEIFKCVFSSEWATAQLLKDEMQLSVANWLKSGKNSAHLPVGPQLERFSEKFLAQASNPAIKEFLGEATKAAQHRARQNYRRSLILFALLAAVVILGSMAGVFNAQLNELESKERLNDNEKASKLAESVGVRSQQTQALVETTLMLGKYLTKKNVPPRHAVSAFMYAARKPYWQQVGQRFSASIRSLTFSPDDKTLLVASANNAFLVNIETGAQSFLGERESHTNTITRVDYSPNKERIVTASMDGTIRSWTASSRELKFKRTGHTQGVLFAIYSPSSQFIVSTSMDRTAQIWNVNSSKERHPKAVLRHNASVLSAAFSTRERYVVTACSDGFISIWEVKTGEIKSRFLVPSARAGARASSASMTGGSAGLSPGEQGINTVLIAPNDSAIVTGGDDGIIRFFPFLPKPKGGWSNHASKTLAGHTGRVLSLAFSPDRKSLVSTSTDHTVRIWDVEAGKEVDVLYGHSDEVLAAAFSHAGHTLATAGNEGIVRLWQLDRRAVQTFHGPAALSIAASSAQRRIVTGNEDLTARIWNLDTGILESSLLGHRGPVRSVAYSPDGKTIATASTDKTIGIWDAASGKRLKTLSEHTAPVNVVAFSADGRLLVSASDDRSVRLWDAKTYDPKRSIEHPSAVLATAFSSSGQYVVAALAEGSIRVWSAQSGSPVRSFDWPSGQVLAVAFSPDDRLLAASNSYGEVQLWDWSTGQPHTWRAHAGALYSLAFSVNGDLLTAGADRFIRIWDSKSRQLLLESLDYPDAIRQAIYLDRGNWIGVVAIDGTIKVVPGSLTQDMKVACNLLKSEPEYKNNIELKRQCDSYLGKWP